MIFYLCPTHVCHKILAIFFAKLTNGHSEAIKILKTDFNSSLSVLEIDFSTLLIFYFNFSKHLKMKIFKLLFFNIM